MQMDVSVILGCFRPV